MWKAITRAVSPAMNRCELSYIDRVEIDIEKAQAQHAAYEECLRAMGMEVIALPAEPDLPDSVFVEDPAIVLDEIAVITRPGAESRRAEGETLAAALAQFRPLRANRCAGDPRRRRRDARGQDALRRSIGALECRGRCAVGGNPAAFWLHGEVGRSARLPAFEERVHLLGRGNRAGESGMDRRSSAGGSEALWT